MSNEFFENTKKPADSPGGRIMLRLMNIGHNRCAMWALSHIDFRNCLKIIDIGCGGGKNISNLLKLAPEAVVCGIDYSAASVKESLRSNRISVALGKVKVKEASVESIPCGNEEFDLVTAFETVYFWPEIESSFKEVARILKKDGIMMVCNEVQGPEGSEMWIKMLKMKIYTSGQIKSLMEAAGLTGCKEYKHANGRWLCVTGRKA